MKITATVDGGAARIDAQPTDPPRIVVRLGGSLRVSLAEAEAVAIAERLIEAIAELRGSQATRCRTETT